MGLSVKFAVADLGELIVADVGLAVPVTLPLQLLNENPLAADAVSSTD